MFSYSADAVLRSQTCLTTVLFDREDVYDRLRYGESFHRCAISLQGCVKNFRQGSLATAVLAKDHIYAAIELKMYRVSAA